ncbi:MAG: response regulator transcription factor [Clostridiales bacterium]|nr:response regulator transcription factor [Clostridiales bacterium]
MTYILIVEDDEAISDLIAMNLSLAGHSYRQIYDGDKFLLVLEKENPYLIILDVMLPGKAEIRLDEHIAIVDGEPVELTAREFALLEVFIQNRNLALSREKLLELAWDYDYLGDTRTVDVHVQKLRKKLSWENYIKSDPKHK